MPNSYHIAPNIFDIILVVDLLAKAEKCEPLFDQTCTTYETSKSRVADALRRVESYWKISLLEESNGRRISKPTTASLMFRPKLVRVIEAVFAVSFAVKDYRDAEHHAKLIGDGEPINEQNLTPGDLYETLRGHAHVQPAHLGELDDPGPGVGEEPRHPSARG